MPRDEAHIIAQWKELSANRVNQLLVISFREIRPADGLLEKHIADQSQTGWGMVETDMARRVAGTVNYIKPFAADGDCVPVVQPAVRFKSLNMRKAKLLGLMGHALDPEGILFLGAFYRHRSASGQFGGCTRMIDMAMRDQDFFENNTSPIQLGLNTFDIATGVHHGTFVILW